VVIITNISSVVIITNIKYKELKICH